jgi:molybdopterin synthase catalytic subunit
MEILITTEVITRADMRARWAIDSGDGAALWFEGIVRDANEGRPVTGIEYTCYASMARREIGAILAEVCERWPITAWCFAHRIGTLAVGEVSLIVGMSAPHRAETFAAMQYCIDELKQRVPIWKKELYADEAPRWLTA